MSLYESKNSKNKQLCFHIHPTLTLHSFSPLTPLISLYHTTY